MSSSDQIMVDRSPSPPHTLTTPDPITLALVAPPSGVSPPTPQSTVTTASPSQAATTTDHSATDTSTEEETNDSGAPSIADDSSNSGSNTESSTSTETPGTVSTPRSTAHDSGMPQPEASIEPLEGSSTQPQQVSDTAQEVLAPSAENDTPAQNDEPPAPPPAEPPTSGEDNVPEWVKYEEDTSVPDADELKEIETQKELDATQCTAVESKIYSDLKDEECRPVKKLRLSWTIKGVRGTRDRPNRTLVMSSPAVLVDGQYWNIKFFPQGNRGRSSLSAFIRCSPIAPTTDIDDLEGSFKCYQGDADADLSKADPILDLTLQRKVHVEPEKTEPTADKATTDSAASTDDSSPPEPAQPMETNTQTIPSAHDEADDDDDSSDDEHEDRHDRRDVEEVLAPEFRVSAQLGMVIYNPKEPRTNYDVSAAHQFCPYQDDWGWDSAVSHWEEIHRRKRGQRAALLQQDTLVLDAYIRIFHDPTKALFWHSSGKEPQWDSKALAGVYPFGTRQLYHSPATAGIAAWSLLAPFRKLIQDADAGVWRHDSSVRPCPLLSQMQLVFYQMRHMKREEHYVHIDSVISELTRAGESFTNVLSFWATFRRGLELELKHVDGALQTLTSIFGNPQQYTTLPLVPVPGTLDLQQGIDKAFAAASIRTSFPDVMPFVLDRQSFDAESRQWKLHHDRVIFNEQIDLQQFSERPDSKYTLYGYVVHDGDRSSGRFFSVLRPAGPGGKWLQFTDGNGNKIFSLTQRKVKEFEGLTGDDLKNASASSTQTALIGLYIRTSQLATYLPSEFENWKMPLWLKTYLDESCDLSADNFLEEPEADKDSYASVEVFWERSIAGQEGKIDLCNMKTSERAQDPANHQVLKVHPETTFETLKSRIAATLDLPVTAFKLWCVNYYRLGAASKGCMYLPVLDTVVRESVDAGKIFQLWLALKPETVQTAAVDNNEVRTDVNEPESPSSPPGKSLDEEGAAPKTDIAATTLDERFLKLGEIVIEAPPPKPEEPANPAEQTVEAASNPASVESAQAIEPTNAGLDTEPADVSSGINEAAPSTDARPPTSGAVDGTFPTGSSRASAMPPSEDASETRTATANSESGTSGDPTVTSPVDEEQESVQSAVAATVDAIPLQVEQVEQVEQAEEEPEEPRAVEHGHLVDAMISESEPVPAPITLLQAGDNGIIIAQSLITGESEGVLAPEDAAVIQALLAEDLVFAEQRRLQDEARIDDDDISEDSRPSTPRPRVTDVYGFLQVFDAEKQSLVAHSTFMVPSDTVISTMVKTQLKYGDDRAIQIWRRSGTFSTTMVPADSTLKDLNLADCCEIIAGDELGSSKVAQLKQRGEFTDPGRLMRYIAMSARRHPLQSRTSDEVLEICEFGGDYYRGPLVHGQRHGEQCKVITSAGSTYEGPLICGQKSGSKGKMTYENGDVYTGDWLDDQRHGQGEFVEKRTGNRYVGGYEHDKRWGKGVTYWEVADQQADLCQICYFSEVDVLFYRCGHICACYECAKQCDCCPICRKSIDAVVKMYRS